MSADEGDELLRRCRDGDADALSRLVLLFQDRLFKLACRVLGDAGRAEEACVDAFVKVWDRCRQWREEASAGTWIHRVALNVILDHARRRASIPLTETADERASPLESLAENERQMLLTRRLDAALSQLTPDDRALLHLYYFEQHSLAEIEIVLGAGRDALKMRLMRARQRLRPLLEGCDELL